MKNLCVLHDWGKYKYLFYISGRMGPTNWLVDDFSDLCIGELAKDIAEWHCGPEDLFPVEVVVLDAAKKELGRVTVDRWLEFHYEVKDKEAVK